MRLAACLLLMSAACASQPDWRAQPPPRTARLELAKPVLRSLSMANGMRITVAESDSLLVSVRLLWRVTRSDVKSGIQGAHRLAATQITRDPRWERVVGQTGAYATWDHDRDAIAFSATTLAVDVDALLGSLSRIIHEPRCDDQTLTNSKASIASSFADTGLAPNASRALTKLVYPRGHTYAPLQADDFANVTCADVIDLMRRAMAPDRLSVVVAGGVDTAAIARTVNGYFGDLAGSLPAPAKSLEVAGAQIVALDVEGSEQTVITMGRFIERFAGDSEMNIEVLRNTAGFAGALLRHEYDIAYGTHVLVDELAHGYELRITTTVPKARAKEAVTAMINALKRTLKIHVLHRDGLFPKRIAWLHRQMGHYQEVGGISNEVTWALAKGLPYDKTLRDLVSLRDDDWGASAKWAAARVDPTALNIVIAGDPSSTGPAVAAARVIIAH